MERKTKEIDELTAMELLSQVVTNAPTIITIGGEKYAVTALKMGTQNLIAEETNKIQRAQEGNLLDIYKQFAQSIPSVIRCLCYAILNDKDKIFKDYSKREFSDEFQALYERIEWESDRDTWMQSLVEIMQRLNLDFFFQTADTLTMIRDMALRTRKTTTEQ